MKSRCINVSSSHSKGHQTKDGRIIGEGPYESDFPPTGFLRSWAASIRGHVEFYREELEHLMENGDSSTSDLKLYAKCHAQHLETFFQNVPNASQFISHSTCFSCLMQVPHNPLPCGHVLCTSCIKTYGKLKQNRVTWEMTYCPLHRAETEGQWSKPWIIKFKPDFAGVRLLSLDGSVLACL
jgi:hypothetical protein